MGGLTEGMGERATLMAVTNRVSSLPNLVFGVASWPVSTRRLTAAVGVAVVLALGVSGNAPWADRLAVTALFALALAVIFGWFEAAIHRVHRRPGAVTIDEGRHGWRVVLVIVGVASALAAQTWFKAGTLIAAGDTGPVIGTAWLSRIFAPWTWSGANLGGPSAFELQLPWGAVLGFVHALGGSPTMAQRIWYTSLFVGAALAGLALLAVLGLRPIAAVIGTCAYLFNAYVVTLDLNPVYLAALILLAGFPAVALAAARRRLSIWVASLLIAATAPLLGYVYNNPPLAGVVVAVLLATPLIAAWVVDWRGARRTATVLALAIPPLFILSLYWIVPAAVQAASETNSQLTTLSSWSWTESRATVRNALWLNTAWAWNYQEYFPFAPAYDAFPLGALKFALPAFAFSALFLVGPDGQSTRKRHPPHLAIEVLAATVALITIYLSTGTRPPGNLAFNALYQLPFGWLLREPGRFLMITGLMYAVLIGMASDHVFGRLADSRYPSRSKAWLRSSAAYLAAASVVLVPGFPLFTGAIVSDKRPILPPPHIRVPSYWTDMAASIDNIGTPGSVLVLPPDDFYQMPYTWGYYGSDAFVAQLFRRPVLDPFGGVYSRVDQKLVDAVSITTSAILDGRWHDVEPVMKALGASLILVRGDIEAAYPGRNIVSPSALADALIRAPNFTLAARAGSLKLFALSSRVPPILERVTKFASINTGSPDLRVLSVVPADTPLVSMPSRPGTTSVFQAPAIETWARQRDENLNWDITVPPGWTYQMVSTAWPPETSKLPQVSPKSATVKQEPTRDGGIDYHVTMPGRSILTHGDFSADLWGPVGDCNNTYGPLGAGELEGHVVPGADISKSHVLMLSARLDSACEAQLLQWLGGPVIVSLKARNIRGLPPRICLWESGSRRCAATAPLPSGPGWVSYQSTAVPDKGTTSLTLFLYADAAETGDGTTNEYADVHVIEVPALPQFFIIGSPKRSGNPDLQLIVLHNSYSSLWTSEPAGVHVIVNGMSNGWLMNQVHETIKLHYLPARIVETAQSISGAAFAILSLGLILALLVNRFLLSVKSRNAPKGNA